MLRPTTLHDEDTSDSDNDDRNEGVDEETGSQLLPTITANVQPPSHVFEVDSSGATKRLPLQREFAAGLKIPDTWEEELDVSGVWGRSAGLASGGGAGST